MYNLPMSVIVNGHDYTITNKGDYRMVLDCFEALNDDELSEDEKVLASLLIFYNDFNSVDDIFALADETEFIELVTQMFEFFNAGSPESDNQIPRPKLIDWKQDENIIVPAINTVANQEVRLTTYMHWWTFIGYFMSVGESTLSTVVSIRAKIVQGKKLENYEKEFKRSNPQYFNWNHQTAEQRALDELARSLWNSK